MNTFALSKAVCQATTLLEQVHADVRLLLTTLEGMMDRAGWRSAYGKRVSWDLSARFDSGCWVLPELWLLFLPKEGTENASDRVVAVSCLFGRLEVTTHDYATFLAALVRFPRAISADEAWKDWQSNPTAYKACLGGNGLVSLTKEQFAGWFPQAVSVSTVMTALCELTDAEVLRAKVVEPILAAESALGANS